MKIHRCKKCGCYFKLDEICLLKPCPQYEEFEKKSAVMFVDFIHNKFGKSRRYKPEGNLDEIRDYIISCQL